MGTFVATAQNEALDGLPPTTTYLAAHSAWSASGANEVSTARTLVELDAAAAGIKDNTNAESIAIPISTTVRWIGIWSAITSGTFYGMLPNGATKAKIAVALDTDTINCAAHGFSGSDKVVFLAVDGAVPTGITEGTVYFIRTTGLGTDTFTVSTTDGGAAVDITGSHECIVSDIIEEVYTSAGNLNLAAGVFDLVAQS